MLKVNINEENMNEYVIDFWSIEKLLNMRTQNCQGKGFKIPLCER